MKRKRQTTYGPRKKQNKRTTIPRNVYMPQRRNIINYQQTRPGGEIKSIDVVNTTNGSSIAVFPFNDTPTLTPLNIITSGSSMFNRIGRKVSMKSVHIQGAFTTTGNTSTVPQFARLIVIYDKQPNGALPNYTDVITDQINNTGGDTKISGPRSGINLNNRDRFEMLIDRRWVLPDCPPTQVAGRYTCTADMLHFEIFKKLKDREVHYKQDSSPGVIGDIATGSLVIITLGDLNAGSEGWNGYLSIRLRYSDL